VRRIWILAWNDLLQTIKDRPSLFWMVIMPVGFILLFGQMYRAPQSTQIALTVIDEDRSAMSGIFTDALSRQGFAIARGDSTAGGQDSSGRAPAAGIRRSVTIPAGFQDSLASARKTPVYLYTNPDADTEASVVAEMHLLRAAFATLFALSSAARDSTRVPFTVNPVFSAQLASIASQPAKITVAKETAGRGRSVPSGMGHSLPATITLFMLINTTIYGAVYLAIEKQERILARIAGQPLSRAQILGGKLLGAILIALAQALLLLLAGRFLLRVYVGSSVAGLLLVIACFALVAASMALFWGAVLRKPEQVTATTLVASLFLGAIGGCWWPLEVVPSWMQTAGHFSPAAWAMDGFHAIISFGGGVSAIALPCLVLLGYALVFFTLGARLLRFSE